MFKSAIVALTLWYVLLTMLLSLAFSTVLYRVSTHELAEALRNQYLALVNNDHDGDNPSYVSSNELDARSKSLLQDLLYFNALVLVGSSVTSFVLARRTLRPLEAAHEAQVRFTADASHELRTPLTAMKADTEATLMERGNGAVQLRRTLEGNLGDIEKLEQLTNHLLEISRYENKTAATTHDINLEAVIQAAVRQFRHRVSTNQLSLTTHLENVHIKGDKQGIRQLVTIVIDNAIKYTQAKGRIEISLATKNNHAVITISDGGIGIQAGDLPHIFDRFYRSLNPSIHKQHMVGYGLGLPLAKEIAEFHQGSIAVRSKANKGTVVTITLPKE